MAAHPTESSHQPVPVQPVEAVRHVETIAEVHVEHVSQISQSNAQTLSQPLDQVAHGSCQGDHGALDDTRQSSRRLRNASDLARP